MDWNIRKEHIEQALEDGRLVFFYRNRWNEISEGKPIVVAPRIYDGVKRYPLVRAWSEFMRGQRSTKSSAKARRQMFLAEIEGENIGMLETEYAYMIVHPDDISIYEEGQ